MENFSIDEILEQAIQTEKLGNRFYTEMAEKFIGDEELRKLFLTLADKEAEHEALFTCMKDTAGKSEPSPVDWEEVSHFMRAIVESEFFLGNKKNLAGMEKITSVAEAAQFALGFEKETMLYFIGLRDVAPQKEAVDAIIGEERCHIKWLSIFRDNLTERGQ
jgi:rubrerythrin